MEFLCKEDGRVSTSRMFGVVRKSGWILAEERPKDRTCKCLETLLRDRQLIAHSIQQSEPSFGGW